MQARQGVQREQQRQMQAQQGMEGRGATQQYGQQGDTREMRGQAGGRGQRRMQTGGTGAEMQQGTETAGRSAGMQGAGRRAGGFPRTGGTQLQSVTLEEVSRAEVVTVDPEETIANVAIEMADKDVGSVIVVEDGEPIGVLTDRKIAVTLGEKPDVADRTAGELVSEGLVTGTPGMSIYEAVQKLRDEGIRRLPIVDDDGRLDGIVTLDDLIVLIAGELGAAAEVIERQSPPR